MKLLIIRLTAALIAFALTLSASATEIVTSPSASLKTVEFVRSSNPNPWFHGKNRGDYVALNYWSGLAGNLEYYGRDTGNDCDFAFDTNQEFAATSTLLLDTAAPCPVKITFDFTTRKVFRVDGTCSAGWSGPKKTRTLTTKGWAWNGTYELQDNLAHQAEKDCVKESLQPQETNFTELNTGETRSRRHRDWNGDSQIFTEFEKLITLSYQCG